MAAKGTEICLSLMFIVFIWVCTNQLISTQDSLKEVLGGNCSKDCMEDPLLLEKIKSVLVQPSGKKPILDNPDRQKSKGQEGQVDKILQHFNNKENGFFIEAGGYDGERLSNTLYLETQLGWTGLLVEANTEIFQLLRSKERNSYSINSCLSTERCVGRRAGSQEGPGAWRGYPIQVQFDANDAIGGIKDEVKPQKDWAGLKAEYKAQMDMENEWGIQEIARKMVDVQCYPLYSILLAMGQTRVDFFSLDVEGSEMGVLKTIPFDKLDIEVFLIETNQSNVTAMNELMSAAGYDMTPCPPYDHLFIKKY